MATILKFECRPAVGGYRMLRFDARKMSNLMPNDDYEVPAPSNATDDERLLLQRWGVKFMQTMTLQEPVEFFLEPNSHETNSFDLFERAPALFLTFAETPGTAQDVKQFADEYGPLFGNPIERLSEWNSSIRQMKKAVTEWRTAQQSGDWKKLCKYINNNSRAGFAPIQTLGPAASVLLKQDPTGRAPALAIQPENLHEALWIQLMLAIAGQHNFRACSVCGSWFQIEAGGGRSDKKYCSDACRMRALRTRKIKRR